MIGDDRDPDGGVGGPADEPEPATRRSVDVRAAQEVQVGDHSTQVIYSYRGTWTDGVVPAPLIGVTGEVESPYRGLGWFSEQDAPFFFGRDSAIEEVLQRLSQRVQQPGILMISGVSGAGKSSLVRAGVIPRIRGQGLAGTPQAYAWPCLLLTAGHSPADELAVAIAQLFDLDPATVRRELNDDPAGFAVTAAHAARTLSTPDPGDTGGLVLVVDQFEQVFTQCPDPTQRHRFITALHAAATTHHADTTVLVVLVVRADFETRCSDYEELVDAIQHHYLVTAMTERQLRMAITEPAKQAGSRVDDELADQLLREVRTYITDSTARVTERSVAGVLPLLSYALDRTWRLRAGDRVTMRDYERSGGLEGAVAESAHRAYTSLTPPQRDLARRVFTRLVVSGSDGTDTADRVHHNGLSWKGIEDSDVDAVLAAFTDERLLTLGADTIEISHEVLLSTWPLLRDTWLAETRENRAVCARLRAAAAEWERHGRDPAYLYSGSVLDTAATTANHVAADPGRYPPLSESDTDMAWSVAFSPDGSNLAIGSEDGTVQLWDTYAQQPIGGRRLTDHTPPVYSVAFGRDGNSLAIGSYDGTVQLWYTRTQRAIGDPLTYDPLDDGPDDQVRSVAFNGNGSTLATSSWYGTVQLWDVDFTIDPEASLCAVAPPSTREQWDEYVPDGPDYQELCP